MLMISPGEPNLEQMRTISPTGIKHERSEDGKRTRRVAQRKEPTAEESQEVSEETMVKIVMNGMRSNDVRTQAMDSLEIYLFEDDDANMAKSQKAFFQVGGHLAVSRAMKERPDCKILQEYRIRLLVGATYQSDSFSTPSQRL
jgi:hypothetical protein